MQKKESTGSCWDKHFSRLDFFRESYRMNLDQSMSDSLPTLPGSIVSILMISTLAFFVFYRIYFGIIRN